VVYSASNITVAVPGMNGQGNSFAQKIAGSTDNSSDQTMNFMDFILARITALQSTQEDLQQITDKASQKTGPLLSTSDAVLVTIAEFLNPGEESDAELDVRLSELSEDAKLALKDLSAAILEMNENGQIELSDEQIEALSTLRDLIVNPEIDVTAVSEEDDSDNTIIIEHGGKKIIIPVVLTKLFANPNSDLPEAALDNNAVINRIVANLEKIAASLDSNDTDNNEIVVSEAELAAAMNAIEPSDSGEENTDSLLENGEGNIAPAVDLAGEENEEENADSNTNETTVVAAAVPAPKTVQSGTDNTLLSNSNANASTSSLTDNMDKPHKHNENIDDSDDTLLDASAKGDKTAAKAANSANNNASAKPSFAAALAANADTGTATPSAADSTDGDMMDDTLDALKSADTLIQANAKADILKGTTTLTRITTTPAAQQVSMQIYKAAVKGDTRITIKLHPEELGKVDVKLEMTKDGKAKASVFADNSDTLNLLSRNANQLQKALNEAGLQAHTGDLSFHLNDGGNNAQTSPQNQNGNHRVGSTQNNNTIETEMPLAPDVLIGEYSVNYKV